MPNVLDDNVVILRFDNTDFEKNTKQSMESLEQLKRTAEDSGAAKGLEKFGRAANQINLSNLERNVDSLNRRFSLLGTIGSAAINTLTSRAVNATTRIATAIPRQIIEGGWKRALNIEQAKFQIEGLKQVWDETSEGYKKGAETIKDSVLYAVNGTAYGLDEAATVAAQFAASGMKAGDEMKGALRGISGVAAMTGSSYADIGRIFTTVAGNGRLMGDQLLQLSGRGVNAAATLTKYFKEVDGQSDITEEKVREMVSDGEISFKKFAKAMNWAFGEHAAKANDTYTGSLSNMKAALSRIGADVEAAKLENMRKIFNALTPVIDQFHTLLGGVISRINGMSTAVTNFAVRGINSVQEALDPYVKSIEKAKEEAAKATKETKENTKETEESAKSYKPIIIIVKSLAVGIIALKKGLSGIIGIAKTFVNIGKGGMAPIFSGIAKGVSKIAEKSSGAASKFKKFTDALQTYAKSGFDKTAEKFGPKAAKSVKKFADNFSGVYKDLKKYAGQAKGFFNELSDKVSNTKGFAKLKDSFSLVGQALAKMASANAKRVMSLFDSLVAFAKKFDILGHITKFFDTTATKIATFIKTTADGTKPLNALLNMITSLEGKVSKVDIMSHLSGATVSKFTTKAGNFSAKALDELIKAGDALQAADIPSKLGKTAQGVKKIGDVIAKTNAKVKLTSAKDGLIGFIKGIDLNNLSSIGLKITGIVALVKAMRDFGNIANATVGMLGSIAGFFKSLSGLVGQIKQNLKVEMFRTIAMSILMIAGAVAILALIPKDRFKPAMAALISLIGLSVAMVAIVNSSKFSAEKMKSTATAFAAMGLAMVALATSCEKIASIEGKDLIKAGITITSFIGMFMLASHASKDIQKSGKSFLAMAAAIDALIFAITALAALSFETLMEGGVAILYLMTELSLASRIAGKSKPAGMLAMAAAVDLLVPALVVLGLMPTDMLIKGAVAIGAIMIELAIASNIASKSGANVKTMVTMATMIGTVATSLAILSFIDPVRLVASAVALVGSITAISKALAMAKNTMKGAITLAAVIALLSASIIVLIKMDVKKSIGVAAGLAAMAYGLAVATSIFATISPAGALTGLAGMSIVISGIIALGALLGGLDKLLKGSISKGLDAFSVIMEKLGTAFGKLVGGFASGASSGLSDLSENLGNFVKDIMPILEAAKGIKPRDVRGLKNLTDAMLSLTKAEFLNGFSSFTGSMDLSGLMEDLGKSFKAFSKVVDEIPEDSVNKASKVAGVVQAISSALNEIPKSHGIAQGFTGWVDLDLFAEGIVKMASTLGEDGKIAKIDIPDDLIGEGGKITKIVSVIKAMAKASQEIPESEGLKQFALGNTTLAEFGEQLGSFAESFGGYIAYISAMEITPDVLVKIPFICKIIKSMAEASQDIPESKGVKQLIFGNTTINEFSNMLVKAIPGISAFMSASSGMEIDLKTLYKVKVIAKAVAAMAEASQLIPESGGFKQVVFGGQDAGNFANQLADFIPGFTKFTDGLKDLKIDKSVSKKIGPVTTALKSMADVANALPKTEGWTQKLVGEKNIGKFGEQLGTLMKSVGDAGNVKVSSKSLKSTAEALNAIIPAVKSLKDIGNIPKGTNLASLGENVASFAGSVAGMSTKGISSKASSVSSAVKKLGSAAKSGASSVAKSGDMTSAGTSIGNSFVKGLKSKESSAKSEGKSVGKQAVSGAKSVKSSMETGGKNVGEGFVNGIKAKESAAYKAGYRLGKKAKQGQKDATKEGSPAKEFIKGGKFAGEGLVIGLKSYQNKVYKSGYKLGQQAVNGSNNGYADIISDLGDPVIRPVIDLSNVNDGIKNIDSSFARNRAIGIDTRFESTDYRNNKLMNEVVDAINKMETTSQSPVNYFTFNVDGAENPEDFANRFVRQVQLEMRTG